MESQDLLDSQLRDTQADTQADDSDAARLKQVNFLHGDYHEIWVTLKSQTGEKTSIGDRFAKEYHLHILSISSESTVHLIRSDFGDFLCNGTCVWNRIWHYDLEVSEYTIFLFKGS